MNNYYTLLYATEVASVEPLFTDLSQKQPFANSRYQLSLEAALPFNTEHLVCTDFSMAHGRPLKLYSNGELAENTIGQARCLDIEGVLRFYWYRGGSSIYYQLGPQGSQALLAFWFSHIFLPLFLSLEEKYDFIHASAVEIAARPVLFLAPSTGGKSTMAEYFLKCGHALISDDKVASYIQDQHFMAVPSHPHQRPYRRFEDLGHRVENMVSQNLPIQAIYELEVNSINAEILIEELHGFKKFESLLPNYLYSFSFSEVRRLHYLAQMVNNIPIYKLTRPWDIESLGDVYNAIVEHSSQLTASKLP